MSSVSSPIDGVGEAVGLLGGSFDPPHAGHLEMAVLVKATLGLNRLILLPSPVPPHKMALSAPFQDRVEMTRLAASGLSGVETWDVENQLPAPHYTVRTLQYLSLGPLAGRRMHWIIGSDSLLDLHLWREPARLFEMAKVVVVSRPGYSMENPHLDPGLTQQIIRIESLHSEACSRSLRRRLADGERPSELCPAVLAHIALRRLYR